MLPSPRESIPPVGLGAASAVLGIIGLLLFFLPILGVPIAGCAFLCAVAGAVTSLWRPAESLRWSLVGICFSLIALCVGLVINSAPVGEEPGVQVPPLWQQPPPLPEVPPPAKPNFMDAAR